MTDQEKIIELTEIVSDSAQGPDRVIELTDILPSDPVEEEKVIELTDRIPETPAEEPGAAPETMLDAAPSAADAVGTDLESALIFDDELEEEFEEDSDEVDDFVGDLGMEIDDTGATMEETEAEEVAGEESQAAEPTPEPDVQPAEPVVAVTEAQIEAAVARILEEKFSQRIEALMAAAVEKAVREELARIRALLSETGSGIDDD